MLSRVGKTLRRVPWWVWLIAAIALTVRLALVGYGLPYELDPDEREFVGAAWQMVLSGRGDPGWYNNPASPLLDVLALLYAAYGLGGALLGTFTSIADVTDAYLADVAHFFVIGRVVAAVSGVAVVITTYALARRLHIPAFWASIAAALIALSWAMVSYSAIVRADMLMSAFLLVTVLASLRALDQPSASAFVLAGALVGLAFASKYPGALSIVPVVAANATLVVEQRITPRRGLVWLGGAALAAASLAALVGPYLFIDWGETLQAVAVENRSTSLGATGSGLLLNMWRYLTEALPWGLGWPATTVGVAGMIVMLTRRRPRLLAASFWLLLSFLSFLSLWWLRWSLPLLPLLAIGAAFACTQVELRPTALPSNRWLVPARLLGAAVLIVPVVGATVSGAWAEVTSDDTRLRAIQWFEQHVPEGSTVLIESFTTQLASDRYDVRVVAFGEMRQWSSLHLKLRPEGYFGTIGDQWARTPEELLERIDEEDVHCIVLSDSSIDAFRDDPMYAHAQAVFEMLVRTYPKVARFDREDAAVGPPLTILDADGCG